jgi:hypothetical protein
MNDHLLSNKKAIIDYILLDKDESHRLSIEYKHKPVRIYGEKTWQEKDLDYGPYFRRNKMALEDELINLSEYLLTIQNLWIDFFDRKSLIELPDPLSPYITIDSFQDTQKICIKSIK